MSTVEADDPSRRHIKTEVKEERSENGRALAQEVHASMDFNHLYGDLYHKLLSTPVQDIFQKTPHAPTRTTGSVFPNTTLASTGSTGDSDNPNIDVTKSFPQVLSEGGAAGVLPPEMPEPGQMNDGMFPSHGLGSPLGRNPVDFDPFRYMNAQAVLTQEHLEKCATQHEPIDIPKLVEEFRVSLERFGVSQRFAARFIMQDTSQGNLSFLMEKGKTKGWEELSVRGRIPYIKMKAWLESKDQQLLTLEMIKQSQEMKKFSPREPYSRRERFSMFQLQVLCHLFEENPNPPMNTRSAVAQSLNIPLDRVNVWFQNQRARGFPAKKILQNSLYNEGLGPEKNENSPNGRYSPSDRKPAFVMNDGPNGRYSPSDKKPPFLMTMNEKTFSQMEGFPVGGDPFALLQNFTSSKFGDPIIKCENDSVHTPLKPSSPLMSSNMKRPGFNNPIDYSTFPFTSNSPLRQSTSSLENAPLHQDYKDNQYLSEANFDLVQIPPQSSMPQSGAAKRKRGKRPQQIIRSASPELPEEWRNNQNEMNPQLKRVKLDDSETNNEQESYRRDNQNNTGDTTITPNGSNVVNSKAVLQSDEDARTMKTNQNVDSNYVKKEFTNEQTDSNDVKNEFTNEKTDSDDVTNEFTNQIFDDDEDDISKTFIAIKSVCAHILNEDKSDNVKDDAKFEEPDLD